MSYNYVGYAVVGDSTVYSPCYQFVTNNRFPVAQAVDLGLPSGTKWASFNLGAQNANERGGLYGWGDITGELSPSTRSDLFAEGIYDSGITNIAGNKDYDIIAEKWGGYWQMPTREQFEELMNSNYTTWESVYDYNGISGLNGWTITSNTDPTKSIFLPMTGYLKNDGTLADEDIDAFYWTSEYDRSSTSSYAARPVGPNDILTSTYSKPFHIGIRGVYCEPIVYPEDSVAAKDVKAVDLGLSVDWANQNIKSASNSSNDAFFSWGNTVEQSVYNSDNYPYLGQSIDKDGYLPTDKDAAAQVWGGTWRMPTIDEWNELISGCTWTESTQNGVTGYTVTSKSNGNSIFLPLSGEYNGSEIYFKNETSVYWSSEPYQKNELDDFAYGLILTTSASPNAYVSGTNDRYIGCLVRPVRAKRK